MIYTIFLLHRDSRRRRRLKRTGAFAPVLTGGWGRSATNKLGSVYTDPLLAATIHVDPFTLIVAFSALQLIQRTGFSDRLSNFCSKGQDGRGRNG